MPVAMERFECIGDIRYGRYDPTLNSYIIPIIVTYECSGCEFAHDNIFTLPDYCPKCHGSCWIQKKHFRV